MLPITIVRIALALLVLGATSARAVFEPFDNCNFDVGGQPVAIVSGDFDRNGNPDLAVVDQQQSRVDILLTNRDRLTTIDCKAGLTLLTEAVLANPLAIAVGDVDHNGTLDLVVAGEAGISILNGNGAGDFTAGGTIVAGPNPQAVAIGDVDGNAAPDIVVGNGFGDTITILYGPEFDPSKKITRDIGGPAAAITIDDLNDDTFDDIVVLTTSGQIKTFLQDEDSPNDLRALNAVRVLDAPTAFALGRLTLAGAADVIPDLALVGGGNVGVLEVYRGISTINPNVPFEPAVSPLATRSGPIAVGVGEFSGDENLDIVVANQSDDHVTFFLGNSSGQFAAATGMCERISEACIAQNGPRSLVAADIDGDGADDVITANEGAASVSLFLSAPNTLPTPTNSPVDTSTPTAIPTLTPTATPTATLTTTETAPPTNTLPPSSPSPSPLPETSCCLVHSAPACIDVVGMEGCAECIEGLDPQCFIAAGTFDIRCVMIARDPCMDKCKCPPETPTPTHTLTPSRTMPPPRTDTPTRTPTATPSDTPVPGVTPSRTPTNTRTPTGTPPTATATGTVTATLTRTPSLSPTPTSKCAGSLEPCIEGQACAIDPTGGDPSAVLWWLTPALLMLSTRSLSRRQ